MTIRIHPVGNRAEFGIVGFQKEKNVLFLLFPKSLDDFKGKRIVGVKLELVEEEGVTGKPKPTRTAQKEIRKPIPHLKRDSRSSFVRRQSLILPMTLKR